VNDVAVQITEKGLVVHGQTVPADAKALEDALARANVKVTYVAPEELPDGIVGAGLRISTQFTIPGNAPSDVVWQFGRALTAIDGAAGGSPLPAVGEVGVSEPGPPPGAGPTVSSSQPPSAEVAASSGALSAGAGAAPLLNASLPSVPTSADTSTAPTSGSGAEAAAPAESAAAPAPAAAPPAVARRAAVSKGDGSGVYLLLVAAGAALFVVAQVLGAVGVRGK